MYSSGQLSETSWALDSSENHVLLFYLNKFLRILEIKYKTFFFNNLTQDEQLGLQKPRHKSLGGF